MITSNIGHLVFNDQVMLCVHRGLIVAADQFGVPCPDDGEGPMASDVPPNTVRAPASIRLVSWKISKGYAISPRW